MAGVGRFRQQIVPRVHRHFARLELLGSASCLGRPHAIEFVLIVDDRSIVEAVEDPDDEFSAEFVRQREYLGAKLVCSCVHGQTQQRVHGQMISNRSNVVISNGWPSPDVPIKRSLECPWMLLI